MKSDRRSQTVHFSTLAARAVLGRACLSLICLSLACLSSSLACSGEVGDTPESIDRIEQPIVLNAGFQHQVVATGLSQPTAMEIAPDGRIFVAQQTGQVKVVKKGALLATSFVELTVDSVNERGLVGITLDPNFASNHYVYVFYTTPSGGTHNRVSRFTANGDVAAAGSEFIVVDFPALSTAGNHNSGALHFGKDGKLYVAHGDNATDANAQNLNNAFGKIHRFNSDGTIPTDNPFYNTSTGVARAIWAYGIRNSFTTAIERATGKIFANDVGGGGPEEINNIVAGANYGQGGGPAPVAPVYSYPRDAGRCAIAGGVFYETSVANFPASYTGKYFFSDYCSGQIWFMNQDGTGVTLFASASNGELNNPVDLDVGLDGSLYYLQRGNGAKIGRIYNPQPTCTTNAQCSDSNVCTGTETCVNGACQAGTPLSCDDGNQCTTNSCNPTSGCNYPDNGLCCATNADCDDGSTCTTDSCVNQLCQNTSNGSCNQCVKIRSQRTNNYLILDAASKVVPVGTQAQAQVFEKVPSGPGFKFKTASGSYMRVVADDLTMDTTDPNAVAFTEFDCSSGGLYPNGKGYASPTGTAPNWKATTTTGPIKSGNGGNGGSCVAGDATSWERFYLEAATCGGSGPVCGDGTCNGSETCSTCAADCGSCGPVCGDGTCNGSETCSSCAADCGSCGSTTRREAEASTYVNSALANEAGSSGGQYVDGNAGANLTWTVSSSGGTTTLDFAIRSPSGARSMGVYVNGAKVGVVTTTTLRPTWAEQGVSATLASGNNTIELRDSENTAEPDFDYVDITAAGGGAVCGDGTCNGTESCSTCSADCGACSTCGNGVCNSGETCSSCQADCGTCSATPAKLALTWVSDNGGWSSVAQLTDGNLTVKPTSNTTPNCIEYNLAGTFTIASARLMEDNAGNAHVDTWKVQYKSGANFVDAVAYTDTPNAMPTWNTLDFPDVGGVNTVRVCLQNTGGAVEAAELEVWGYNAPAPVCGDRSCNGSETCTSCPWDCNTCTGGQLGLDSRPSNTACVAGSSSTPPPALLSGSPCVVSVANPPVFAPGVIPYSIAEPFWSDSALKTRFLALPNGTTFAVQSNGDWNLPPGAVTIKNFQWQGQYFETRFFVRFTDGTHGAWTYMWNDAQTEAFLVDAVNGGSKTLPGGHVWNYPTQAQCFQCHTDVSGFSLGLETRQLNVNQVYPTTGRNANQFDTLNGIGMLSANPTRLTPFPGHNQTAASLQMRADAYLHENCSNCHRPGGPGYGTADYRYDTPFANKNICNQQSILSAYSGLDLIEPGDHANSVVWLRMSQRTANFMPPIASKLADAEGATVLQQWIDQLTGCPSP
jgi:glucose/arabinose dehydrogenase